MGLATQRLADELAQPYQDFAASVRPGDLNLHPLPQHLLGQQEPKALSFPTFPGPVLLVIGGAFLAAMLLRGIGRGTV